MGLSEINFDCYRTKNLKGPISISSVTVSLRSKHFCAVSELRAKKKRELNTAQKIGLAQVPFLARQNLKILFIAFFALKVNQTETLAMEAK